jgi:DNA polymerase elongation subunit (family B)
MIYHIEFDVFNWKKEGASLYFKTDIDDEDMFCKTVQYCRDTVEYWEDFIKKMKMFGYDNVYGNHIDYYDISYICGVEE